VRQCALQLRWPFLVHAAVSAGGSSSTTAPDALWEHNKISDIVTSDGQCCNEEYLESAETQSAACIDASVQAPGSDSVYELPSVSLRLLPPASEASPLNVGFQTRAAALGASLLRIAAASEFFLRLRDWQDRESACAALQSALNFDPSTTASRGHSVHGALMKEVRLWRVKRCRVVSCDDDDEVTQTPVPEKCILDMLTRPTAHSGALSLPQLRALLAAETPNALTIPRVLIVRLGFG